jgi:hypothetical protein
MATIFNTLIHNSTRSFQPVFILNNNDCCIESLSVDSCSSLHLQALEGQLIKTINYLSKDQKFGYQILLENIKHFQNKSYCSQSRSKKFRKETRYFLVQNNNGL